MKWRCVNPIADLALNIDCAYCLQITYELGVDVSSDKSLAESQEAYPT